MNKKFKLEAGIFIGIIILAVFFRFYQLETVPPGLWPDEAANGVDALKALESSPPDFKIFYPDNNGREGLFINMQAVSISLFGPEPWALRLISAIIGTLTVIGLYLLTRFIFDWRTASVAGFFLAISFWHVNFSRIGFRAIMLPFILVWAFYFLWRGLRSGHFKEFFTAGIIAGTGFYTYFSYRIAPLIVLILFFNYWAHIKKVFDHSKYEDARNRMLRGFALLTLTTIIIALPIGIYFYTHSGDFLKRDGRPISVFAQEDPLKEFGLSVVKTLGMFNFSGDFNQRHNIPGWPALSLPIGLLFAVGFLKESAHLLSKRHGRFSTLHTFLFSWFFIMLLPGFLSTEAPHALRVTGVIPVVMIFAARGFWWLENQLMRFYKVTDPHTYADYPRHMKEARRLAVIALIAFMTSLVFIEYNRYFRIWADNPSLKNAFSEGYKDIGNFLVKQDLSVKKYVLVNEGDVMVDGVPNNAQAVRFYTLAYNDSSSLLRNIYYLRSDQLETFDFPNNYLLIPLSDSAELNLYLRDNFGLVRREAGNVVFYAKQ